VESMIKILVQGEDGGGQYKKDGRMEDE